MKILQVVPSLAPGFGGPTNEVLGYSFALAKHGQEVTIFTTDADVKGRLSVPLEVPVIVQNVNVVYFPVQYLKHYKFSWPLVQALRKNILRFDIVHIYSLFQFSTLITSYYCQKYNKPYIIGTIGQLDPFALRRHALYKKLYLSLFERNNLERSSAIHFTTDEERRLTAELDLKARSIVVGLGVDFSEFQHLPEYGTFRLKYPHLKDKKIILFLSRINFKKGLDILVEAFGDLARNRDDVHLVISGPDHEGYGRKVKRWLKKKGVLNRVTFTGMLVGQEKIAVFRDSDIFVLPSYSENFGIVVIEAMATGLPVIISNRVNIAGDIVDTASGIVIEPDPSQLYDAFVRLLDNHVLRKQLGEKAREIVKQRFSWDKIAKDMIAAYESIRGR